MDLLILTLIHHCTYNLIISQTHIALVTTFTTYFATTTMIEVTTDLHAKFLIKKLWHSSNHPVGCLESTCCGNLERTTYVNILCGMQLFSLQVAQKGEA